MKKDTRIFFTTVVGIPCALLLASGVHAASTWGTVYVTTDTPAASVRVAEPLSPEPEGVVEVPRAPRPTVIPKSIPVVVPPTSPVPTTPAPVVPVPIIEAPAPVATVKPTVKVVKKPSRRTRAS